MIKIHSIFLPVPELVKIDIFNQFTIGRDLCRYIILFLRILSPEESIINL